MHSTTRLTKHRLTRVTALGLGLLASASVATAPALAATATSSAQMSATVVSECGLGVSPLGFGPYDPITTNKTTPRDASVLIFYFCTLGSNITITLGQGLHAAGGSTEAVPLRRMSAAGSFLSYFLYQEAARTTVWGNTPATGEADTGTAILQAMEIFGRIPAGQNVPAGSYTDTVVATINF